jgi:hypothetical protein
MRKRRRTVSLLVVLGLCVGGSLLFVGSAAAIDIEPFVQFIDHGIPGVDDLATGALEGSAKLPDYFGDVDSARALNRLALGFDPEKEAPTTEEIQNDTDWCLWSGLSRSGVQIADGDATNDDGSQQSPVQILAGNITPCLQSRLDTTDDQITALTNTLVTLVQVQSGTTNWSTGAYDPTAWANWFSYASSTIPPAN